MAGKPRRREPTKDVTFTTTPTAIANLDKRARELGISRSELITRIALGEIALNLNLQQMGEFSAS